MSRRSGLLDELLEKLSCRALLIVARSSRDPFLAPLIGQVRLNESFLVARRGRPPRLGYMTPMERGAAAASGLDLLTPEDLDVERWNRDGAEPHELLANVLARALHLCELAPGPLALAGHAEAGRLQAACALLEREGWSFVPGEALSAALRRRKTAAEVEAIRRVAAATGAAFRHAARVLADAEVRDGELWAAGAPLTAGRLRRVIATVLFELGLEQPEGSIVAAAEEGAVPHTISDDGRVLRAGESLIVDLFPRQSAPWGTLFADCTRTFCVGEPAAALAEAHARVLDALRLAHERARPGVCGWSLQEAVCGLFDRAGYPTPVTEPGTTRGYVHGLGHGVGYEVHEAPSFKEHAESEEGVLATGDVFALEPGLYDPDGGWAVRLEDLFHLGEDGLENLTPLPYALDPREWQDAPSY